MIDRRTFIKGIGIGAGAVASGLVFVHGAWLPEAAAQRMLVTHGSALRGVDLPKKQGRYTQGRFGFMFPDQPAYEVSLALTDALAANTRDPDTGGRGTALGGSGDNDSIPSGFTFFGQFIDHDLTMDRETLGNQQADPDGAVNFRSPTLNLDSVYNSIQPDGVSVGATRDGAKIRLQTNVNGVLDLPRNSDGTAQIADPRNEENLIILQLHLAVIRFHNRLVDQGKSFEEARRLTTWHFQWVVMTDFLPRIVGQDRLDQAVEIKKGDKPKVKIKFYKPNNLNKLFTPLEFAVAAFRFGHTQVRNLYSPNQPPEGVTEAANRRNIQQPIAGDTNLNGFRPIPNNLVIDFRRFFLFPDSPTPAIPPAFNSTRGLDAILSPNLLNLPVESLPNAPDRTSLPSRNLQRGVQVGLPSGQAVARAIGAPVLANVDLAPGATAAAIATLADPGFQGECPLWFYLLAESGVTAGRQRLGAVGGTLVAETFAGIMDADKESFFQAGGWQPMSSTFRMQEFLTFAGVISTM
jgi:Animal haem peroxidase